MITLTGSIQLDPWPSGTALTHHADATELGPLFTSYSTSGALNNIPIGTYLDYLLTLLRHELLHTYWGSGMATIIYLIKQLGSQLSLTIIQ